MPNPDEGGALPTNLGDPERLSFKLTVKQVVGLIGFVLALAGWGYNLQSKVIGGLDKLAARLDGTEDAKGIARRLADVEVIQATQKDRVDSLATAVHDQGQELDRQREAEKTHNDEMNKRFGTTLDSILTALRRR